MKTPQARPDSRESRESSTESERLIQWVQRGKQKREVARALYRLNTATMTELLLEARPNAPRLQLRDIWHILRQCEARGLVECLTPNEVTGKVFSSTVTGSAVFQSALNPAVAADEVSDLPSGMSPSLRAWLMRGKARRAVYEEILRAEAEIDYVPLTASDIRSRLRERNPMGLNQVIRAIHELERRGLVEGEGYTRARNCRCWRPVNPESTTF